MHPGVIITSALALVIGLAIVAVIVSQKAQTPNVISAAGTALSTVIQSAVSPVTGTSPTTTGAGGWLGGSNGNLLPGSNTSTGLSGI
jgi:hypothetical protein